MKKLMQDKVLEVLQGNGRGKRAPRFGTMDVYLREGGYLIQYGGKTLVDAEGTVEEAKKDAQDRAERLRDRTGKAVVVNIY